MRPPSKDIVQAIDRLTNATLAVAELLASHKDTYISRDATIQVLEGLAIDTGDAPIAPQRGEVG